MSKLMTTLILASVLAGCATAKPQMPDENYGRFARGWAGIHHCNAAGNIDPEVTALARTYIVSSLNPYSYDRVRIETEARQQAESSARPTIQECRELAAMVYSRKQQIDNQNATAAIQQREAQSMINATKPTNTYCNKIGTQVLCNSF